jgi:threonine 3-dehydrogenase
VDVSPLITHRFPLDDFQEAMAQMKSGRSGKVVLLPNGG